MRSVEEQRRRVLAEVRPLETRDSSLEDAVGLTLAQPVRAAVPLPLWDNSSMDGFAVRYDDVRDACADAPVVLRVIADVFAGSAEDPPLAPGEAARIMTGAPLPTAADTIVPFESTRGGVTDSLATAVIERAPDRRGAHVRRRAEDAEIGAEVVPSGALVGPLQVSAAAACGVARVRVTRAPRVAVISTGTELVPPGTTLVRGQIPESNSRLLAGLVAETGAEIVFQTTVDDAAPSFVAATASAEGAGADVIVTSGGVSAGAFEVVREVLSGSDVEFAQVAMQPGRPQAFGRLPSGVLLFGLPGNPVSAAVSFEVFVRPALLAMQGRVERDRAVIRLPASRGWRTPIGRTQYVPARIDRSEPARWTFSPALGGGSGSHRAAGLAAAEAYAVVPPDVTEVLAGDLVDVLMIV